MRFSTALFDSEFIPATTRVSSNRRVSARPLCIVLHGKGDSLNAYMSIDKELGLQDFDFLLLNGPMRFSDGFKWIHDEPRHRLTLAVVRDQLLALVEELKDYGYRTENIVWLGHSQGGRVASDLVMNSPDRFMAMIAVSSYVGFFEGWADQSAGKGAWRTPWLFTHGTDDTIIRLREIRNDIRELNRGRIPVTYREFDKGHDFDHVREMPYIRQWVLKQLENSAP